MAILVLGHRYTSSSAPKHLGMKLPMDCRNSIAFPRMTTGEQGFDMGPNLSCRSARTLAGGPSAGPRRPVDERR